MSDQPIARGGVHQCTSHIGETGRSSALEPIQNSIREQLNDIYVPTRDHALGFVDATLRDKLRESLRILSLLKSDAFCVRNMTNSSI